MAIITIFFLITATLLWLSTVGYIVILKTIARGHSNGKIEIKDWPEISVVIPTLNEKDYILQKLADLKYCDYPAELNIHVIDGGSSDQTESLVQKEIDRGTKIQFIKLENSREKIKKVKYAIETLHEEFLVFTDADSKLSASCIKELIQILINDPQAALVGATIFPGSQLLEEHLHWHFMNFLWWLEGEALSSAGITGVCYAVRREAIKVVDPKILAEDMHLALSVSASGYRSRLCRAAHATELRVPQSLQDFLKYRRRRGWAYFSALTQFPMVKSAPLGCKVVRLIRILHFFAVPKLVFILFVLGLVLLISGVWLVPSITLIAFTLPSLSVLFRFRKTMYYKVGWREIILAAARILVLNFIALVTLQRYRDKYIQEDSI